MKTLMRIVAMAIVFNFAVKAQTVVSKGCESFYLAPGKIYVKVFWENGCSCPVDFFKVYRNTSADFSGAILVGYVAGNAFEFCDTSVAGNTKYFYFVSDVKNGKEGFPVGITDGNGVLTYRRTTIEGVRSYVSGSNLVFTWNPIPNSSLYVLHIFKNDSLILQPHTSIPSYTISNSGNDVWAVRVAAFSLEDGVTCLSEIYTASSSTAVAKNSSPAVFSLFQNYPNPFNPETTIEFTVKTSSHISLRVFNLIGEEVAILADEIKSPGNYRTKWNATSFPAGIYFYRLEAGGIVQSKKMTLVR